MDDSISVVDEKVDIEEHDDDLREVEPAGVLCQVGIMPLAAKERPECPRRFQIYAVCFCVVGEVWLAVGCWRRMRGVCWRHRVVSMAKIVPRILGAVLSLYSVGFLVGSLFPRFGLGFSECTSRIISLETRMQNSALAVVLETIWRGRGTGGKDSGDGGGGASASECNSTTVQNKLAPRADNGGESPDDYPELMIL